MTEPTTDTAYVTCESNATLATVDLAAKALGGTQPTSDGPDVVVLDGPRHRLWIAAESGHIDLFDTSSNPPTRTGSDHPHDDAHTIAVDPATGYVHLPITDDNGAPALWTMAYS